MRRYRIGAPELLIVLGAVLFVVVLAIAAVAEGDIRWLHFFQAFMYIACVALAINQNRWGYFVGISAAGFWDYGSLFVNAFFMNGVREIARWTSTGRIERPDQLIAVPAWIGNLLIVIGCVWAYWRHVQSRRHDVWRFLLAFALTSGFFAADMAIFQPRYLSMFPRALHPRWPR